MFEFTTLQFKRGNTEVCDRTTLREGAIMLDLQRKEIRVHDGFTPGGVYRIPSIEHIEFRNDEFVTRTSTSPAINHNVNGYVTVTVPTAILENMNRVKVLVNDYEISDWAKLSASEIEVRYLTNVNDQITVYSYQTINDVVVSAIAALELGNTINDSVTATDSTWSSNKLSSELETRVTESDMKTAIAQQTVAMVIALGS